MRLAPGAGHDITPDRIIEWRPEWPVAGPNGVRRVTCGADRLPAVIAAARQVARSRGVRLSWRLDEWNRAELEPVLLAHGILPADEMTAMELVGDVQVPPVPGLELADGMAGVEAFQRHAATVAAAFRGSDEPVVEGDHRLRFHADQAPGRHLVTALVFGEPAGGGELLVEAEGSTLSGAGVLPRFRRRGVYRALVAERVSMARDLGAQLIVTNARPTARLVLWAIGFQPIGRWWSYRDETG